MHVVITGGSGFVGQELTRLLESKGHTVTILTRKNSSQNGMTKKVQWLANGAKPEIELHNVDAVVNLAGTSINDGRWTEEHKEKIYESRMEATDELLRIVGELEQKPNVWINASAIGIYPASTTAIYTENSIERGTDFLAKTVIDWEQKAEHAEKFGTRVASGRFGIILGKDEGALPLMATPYKMGVGGKIGSGDQWLSWVHVHDVARAIVFAMENEHLHGPFNVVAPDAKQNNAFGKILGAVLNRPHWFPVPSFILKAVLGDKSALVLEGQHVKPEKLESLGFQFQYPTLTNALHAIYS
ncbi:TIGR01777 family oxidoreductase [Paenisporosarcina cavernae]|uniref:TIGR01777 family protein n=1 Tax=Paenisporosarcina cavernae TaxID=2320858 RepID=A0A385YTM3_9BACL|nr:TIGR01777 family oxidoreductase [Paenisporosarcina cavernae]AYC30235.1 TIGR01777 family protein [Paenisporosarcina cavernae]